MAAMTTALTEFSDNGNSRTYVRADHTALMPKLVIQKRKVPQQGQVVLEDIITVISAVADVDGVQQPSRVVFEVSVRRPTYADATTITNTLAVLRDIVAGDEFTNMVNTQEFLK